MVPFLRGGLIGSALVVALAIWSAPLAADSGRKPAKLVDDFHAVLIDCMKNADVLGVMGRFHKISPDFGATFHPHLMIQVATGSFWKKATEDQRHQLIDAFSKMSAATYASQFKDFTGERFEFIGVAQGPQKTTLVKTRIIVRDGDNADLTYVAKVIKGEWRIIDVLVDSGISELARKRSEYRGILKSGGVDGLVATLNRKTDSLLHP